MVDKIIDKLDEYRYTGDVDMGPSIPKAWFERLAIEIAALHTEPVSEREEIVPDKCKSGEHEPMYVEWQGIGSNICEICGEPLFNIRNKYVTKEAQELKDAIKQKTV